MAKRWDTDGGQKLGRMDTDEESLGACSDSLYYYYSCKEKFELSSLTFARDPFQSRPSGASGKLA